MKALSPKIVFALICIIVAIGINGKIAFVLYNSYNFDDISEAKDDRIFKIEKNNVTADLSGGQSFSQRPLFLPLRRPVAKPTEAVQIPTITPAKQEAKTISKPKVVLLGVIRTPRGREAIFRDESGATIILKEGELLDSWTLRSVRVDRVVFKNDNEEYPIMFLPHGPEAAAENISTKTDNGNQIVRRRQ